ncbi:hypothetical protein [Leifsonia xyli]|uniref:hypothetical protein n=1 Tax=Leifsonia xyli TaxID=1575 RepID=UPI000402E9F1|nr:hypothetical protein [Leifsonia xyli]
MTSRTLLRRPAARLAAAAVAAAATAAALLPATLLPAAPAAAATAATYSASGVEIIDIDDDTLQAPKPSVSWTTGAGASSQLDATGDVLRLNTTRTSDLAVTAGPTGATAAIGSGEFTLRDRVPVTFRGLSVSCGPTQASVVSFTALTVNGTDITATATATPGFTYQLPSSRTGRPRSSSVSARPTKTAPSPRPRCASRRRREPPRSGASARARSPARLWLRPPLASRRQGSG